MAHRGYGCRDSGRQGFNNKGVLQMDHSTSQQRTRIATVKAMIETPSLNTLSQETIRGAMDFVAAYSELGEPLPVDPVAVVLAYEVYQNKLADEAAGINWLVSWQADDLINGLRRAIEESERIIGCNKESARDSMILWTRGAINRIARGMSKW